MSTIKDQILSYPVFYHLAENLNSRLKNAMLVDAYAVSKDQIVFEFAREDKLCTSLICYTSTAKKMLWYVDEYAKPRSKYISKFQSLIAAEVTSVHAVSNERCLIINFNNGDCLSIVFMGNKHFIYKDRISDKITLPDGKELPNSKQEDFSLEDFLIKKLFTSNDQYIKWKSQPIFYLYEDDSKHVVLSLEKKDNHTAILESLNVEKALHQFAITWFSAYGFESRFDKIEKYIDKQIVKNEHSIKQAEKQLFKLKNELNYQQTADIIMANLQNLVKGMKEAILFNFYSNEMVTISLKEKLSPQENAHRLYKKAKNQGLQEKILNERIDQSFAQLEQLATWKKELNNCTQIKELQKLEKIIFPIKTKNEEKEEKFNSYSFQGFQIYVGRNSKNNDELTTGFASKNDLWLHAKDVSGSHVVIRNKGSETKYPKIVIQFAANLALKFSKAKNANTHPVMFTQKKHVRKVKGAATGQVLVDKYEIIFASNEDLNS